jgi:ribosome maturation factor RimP
VSAPRDVALDELRSAAARVVESHGLELFDLQFRRESTGWVLRVIIDRPGPIGSPDPTDNRLAGSDAAAPPVEREEPVGIEDCQHVSHDLGTLLDVDDRFAGVLDREYTLEVSSPGLDRPLRGEADYRRFVGRLAKVVTEAPVNGQSSFAGRLSGVEDGMVLMTEGRRVHRVPIAGIRRARLEVEF